MNLIIPLAILVLPALVWGLSSRFSREHTLSGRAEVRSHRVARREEMPKADTKYVGNWNYLVTFSLSGGEELELYTSQTDFRCLTDGTAGWLTWQGKWFCGFEPEM